jgi:DNA-binding NtrC family response regulator
MTATLRLLAAPEQRFEWIVALERERFIIDRFATPEALLQAPRPYDEYATLVRLDQEPQALSKLLKDIRTVTDSAVILIQSKGSPDLAFVARSCGASDYLREPIIAADLIASVETCLAEKRNANDQTRGTDAVFAGERMVGGSPAMNQLRQQILKVAATDCNVLVTGETGTGKELAAELIYLNSFRKERRFVCINCAAIPDALLESELFGYEQGAFTGAHTSRPGQLELADGGVLFLDEIGEMSLPAQAKILRAIDHKEVQRLGRRTGIKVDIRIICATNRDLEAEVKRGAFRADLFFRLNVAHLQLPPLRTRKEDLSDLANLYC